MTKAVNIMVDSIATQQIYHTNASNSRQSHQKVVECQETTIN